MLANSAFGQNNACDLDSSGSVNVVDVNRAVSMALGSTPCTANVEAANTCTIVTVQRVVNNALGQPCVTYGGSSSRRVSLLWIPSISLGVVGYNVYRRTTPTGNPTKVNTAVVTGVTFLDTAVSLSSTYYYTLTAVDGSGNESPESTQVTAVIPAL